MNGDNGRTQKVRLFCVLKMEINMERDEFYSMLAEIDNAIADESCGCMGCRYTPKREKEAIERGHLWKDGQRSKPGHYLLHIFKQYGLFK